MGRRKLVIPAETVNAVLADRERGVFYRTLAEKHGLSLGTIMRLVAKHTGEPKSHRPAIRPTWAKTPVETDEYWTERLLAEHRKYQFLTVAGRGASLSVRDKQLCVYENGRETLFMPGAPPFQTVLIESFGSSITGDAVAWLHRHGICLVMMCGGEPVTVASCLPMSKVELRQRQYARLSEPIPIARAILEQKMRSGLDHERFTKVEFHNAISALRAASTMMELHLAEARAATIYFERFNAALDMRYKKTTNWPGAWCGWPGRLSPIGGMRAQHSLHPVNSLLNCAYSVAAAQLTRALTAAGLDAACGYLHQPEDARASLAWDALELLRAGIDTRILSLIANRVWSRDDFELMASGVVRLSPWLARVATGRGLATKRDLAKVCDFVVNAVMRSGRANTQVVCPSLRAGVRAGVAATRAVA